VAVQGEGIAGVSIEQPLPVSKLAELTKVAMANCFYRLAMSQWPGQERRRADVGVPGWALM
jgi:hypothetical protein